jgi:predicted transcriptional regulator
MPAVHEQLIVAIAKDGRSRAAIGRLAGMNPSTFYGLLHGRDVQLSTLGKVLGVLDMELRIGKVKH